MSTILASPASSLLERLAALPAGERALCLAAAGPAARRALAVDWRMSARASQLPPRGDWQTWLILAGRGFGKTRAGAEWVTQQARAHPRCRVALLGATAAEAVAVMVQGESGVLAVARPSFRPAWRASTRELLWPNGAIARVYSALEPDRLRGPQFHFAWCDELAAWQHAEASWSMLRMGLRLGELPRALVTTTPRPVALVKRLIADPRTVVVRGRTTDNRANLSASFLSDMVISFGGSALGRQELDGELVEDVAGALWPAGLLDGVRRPPPADLRRVVVGVDPPADRGTCGIVVVALDAADPPGAHVLADASVGDTSPDRWAAAVASAAARHGADLVVAEVNNGGAMVEAVLRAASVSLPLKTVRATQGKAARAEPVAALYAAGRVHHARPFAELEAELRGLVQGGGYVGPGTSPDRADALVWALTELLLRGGRAASLRTL